MDKIWWQLIRNYIMQVVVAQVPASKKQSINFFENIGQQRLVLVLAHTSFSVPLDWTVGNQVYRSIPDQKGCCKIG
jgi:hypothetical protein